jgi:flagellar protein FliL
MATAVAAKEPAAPAAGEGGEQVEFEKVKRKLSGKRMAFLIGAPILVIGILLGLTFSPAGLGLRQTLGLAPKRTLEAPPPPPKQVVFMDLPEMIVNLNTGGPRSSFLKLRVALELDDPAMVPKLKALEPRIIDNFQIYLRDLRREDLDGSAGMARLKEELLMRINVATRPARINDVLFNEILVQ